VTDGPERVPKGVDLERPNAARIYDVLLGGTHNWAVDRLFAEEAVRNLPLLRTIARANREFLGRAVRHCARLGITQFLDIGSGVPTMGNVHEVADEVSKDTRCVYVDFEPVAVVHCRLLLQEHGDPKRHAVLEQNLVNVDAIWEEALATGVLDPSQPIALVMAASLPFVSPDREAQAAVQRYRELLPSGSYLVISHLTENGVPDNLLPQLRRLVAQYKSSSTPLCLRSTQEIAAFFGDFDLLEPGLVWLPQWHLDERESPASAELADTPEWTCGVGAVGRKPGP
jgi:hypothetical protein